jgi:enoyl-CoA hydratase
MSTAVIFEEQGHVGHVTFVSPNDIHLMSLPLMTELEHLLTAVERKGHIRVLVFKGEGRTFLAGADIDEMSRAPGDFGRAFSQRGQQFMARLARFEHAVTIAAINGAAMGGGCEFALACDLRIIAEGAKIGFPEVGLGLIPGWGGTQRAFALIGPARVRRMVLTGAPISARTACEVGLVNECVSADELMATAERIADEVLSNGPAAVRLVKHVLCAHQTAWLEKGFAGEAESFGKAFLNEESREGLRAFLEKRQPSWGGDSGKVEASAS